MRSTFSIIVKTREGRKMGFFSQLKEKFKGSDDSETGEEGQAEDYVELSQEAVGAQPDAKIVVRPFTIEDFEDIKPVIDVLREGYTIPLVNIRPLKDKDLVELKRAVNKLKKTTDAIDGDIAGFGEDWIVVTPSFAKVYRTSQTAEVKSEDAPGSKDED